MQVHGHAIRVGVHSGQQYAAFSDLLELWHRAEQLGYDWVSVFDHLRPPLGGPAGPCFEGTTVLAALAARTTRVRCAMLVSAVTWRHPALLAALAATIDHISGGRAEFGLGAGGADLGYEQYGIPFPRRDVRLSILDEACQVVRSLWDNELTSFEGEHFRLADARLSPRPLQPRLPLIIGAEGERRTLRLVARHADIWNVLVCDPATYRRKLDDLAGHCAAVGRDPADIRKSMTFRAVLAQDERSALRRAESLPLKASAVGEYLVFGTPEHCASRLRPYLELGVGDFLLGMRPPVDWTTIELFARQVAPILRAHAESDRPVG
jgi:alkanesulfonate monooxygenase SsuD/methylene tetrahydromethanopterin reductase-like flavin-dependent oxidoreductase (luciferase family)